MPPSRPSISGLPWYKVGVMWVFVGGLGAVVVAGFALLATAAEHRDVELHSVPMKPASYYKAPEAASTAVPHRRPSTP